MFARSRKPVSYSHNASKSPENAKPLSVCRGEIKFENVAFGYIPDRQILKRASFTIPAGKKVAIVGPSGCGKSTILRLLFRSYDVEAGRILIDGQDVRQVDLDSLRKEIAVVPQDAPLFHSDIMHNIRYGRMTATDAEVKEAARKANIYDTIESFPQKWETQVGERGFVLLLMLSNYSDKIVR